MLPALRKTFAYTKWQDGLTPYVHLGRRVTQARNRIILDQEKYALGLKQILVDKPRRSELKQSTTPQETTALRASNGKVAWINKTRMDVASRLSGVQQEVTTATVSTIHEHNKLVVQCVRDSFLTLEFVPVRFWDDDFGTLAVSDSSFTNALEDESAVQPGDTPTKIDCQQGFVSVVGNIDDESGRVRPANVVLWRTHKGRRKNRLTLGAEAGAMSDGVNSGEMVRGYFAEVLLGRRLTLRPHGYPKETYERDIQRVRMIAVTDCRSLYDNLVGIGKRPSEARLALDISAIKEFAGIEFRWTRTQQMIADPLTKSTAPIQYLLWLLWKHEWYFRHDPKLDEKFAYVKEQLRRLRHEQWLKRRSTRGAEKTYFSDSWMPVDEGAELRMERRGIALSINGPHIVMPLVIRSHFVANVPRIRSHFNT